MEKLIFDHTNHKKMWDWLSKHPRLKKLNWPEWVWNYGKVQNVAHMCFACDYAYEVTMKVHDKRANKCYHCPFKHPTEFYDGTDCLLEEFALWNRFNNDVDYKLAAECARKIRDWPVRSDVFTK